MAQATALARARHQHQDWFDDNDAVISNLLAEKNRPHKACVKCPIGENKAAFCCSRRLVQQRLRKMQDAWTVRKAGRSKTQILKRQAEHFRGVLDCSSAISDVAVARLSQVGTNADLYFSSSLYKTIRAVQRPSSGEAPGSDAIRAEIYKHGGPQQMNYLTALFQEMWLQVQAAQVFKDVTKGIVNSATTTEDSRCSTSPDRSSHAFSPTSSTAI
nr:unnamed protein product [Spirometra erinaceieuropaei]